VARAQPKLDWLDAARVQLNDDPAFRKLGSTDLSLGLSIGDERRLVVFEAFEITEIREIRPADLRDADILIEMSPRDWNAYLRKRGKGKGPTLLTLDLDDGVVSAADPLAQLKLARYNRTVQMFLDTGAALAA
jgi:hypothetical protein